METVTRSRAARIGLLVLNLVGPGLGFVRLGFFRSGLFWALLSPVFILLICGLGWIAPPIDFAGFILTILALLVFQLAIIIVPARRLWSLSVVRRSPPSLGSRWYSLVALWLMICASAQFSIAISSHVYHSFYVPAEAMAPTLEPQDRFFADMRRKTAVGRGDVVLFRINGVDFVKRIVALPGDRVAMRRGVPVINDVAAGERREGPIHVLSGAGAEPAMLFTEHLPAERQFHRMAKIGVSPFDDLATETVPAGRVFVLGDNRDRSDDSRVPADQSVIGMPALASIIGRPLFVYWSRDRTKIGKPVF